MNNPKDTSKDEAIQFCIDQVLDGRWSVEECLERFPQYRRDILDLMPLLQHLQMATTVRPRPEFRQRAVVNLQRRLKPRPESDSQRLPALASLFGSLRLRPQLSLLAGLALVLLIVGAASLMLVRAADAAVPGDSLYRIDLGLERAQISLRRDPQTRTRLHFQFAQERLDEAAALAREGQSAGVQEALIAYSIQMQDIEFGAVGDAEIDSRMTEQEREIEIVFSELATAAGDGDLEVNSCVGTSGAADHPAIRSISAQFNVPAQMVSEWYCSNHNFGEIVVALVTADKYEVAPGPVLALRERTTGWGALAKQLEESPPGGPALLSPTTEPAGTNADGTHETEPPRGSGPPEGAGPPEDAGPPADVGAPDHAGPPEDAGPPEGAGPPENPGRPDNPGPPEGAGPPENPGPPEGTGPPEDKGPPNQGENRGNNDGNNGNNGENRGQSNRP